MSNLSDDITKWLRRKPLWLQEAANKLINQDNLSIQDIEKLVEICKGEIGVEQLASSDGFQGELSWLEENDEIKISSIHSINNINALAPRNPLNFEGKNLSIVYGGNGTGKSSYTRILKNICGAKNPGELFGNVYEQTTKQDQECSLVYSINGKQEEIKWNVSSGVIDCLGAVEIFDSECAYEYVNNENEVTYEPSLLSFLSHLIEVCSLVKQKLFEEIDELDDTLKDYPINLSETESIKWYQKLNKNTLNEEIDEKCTWTVEMAKEENDLILRLAEKDHEKKIQELFAKKRNLTMLIDSINNINENFSAERREKLLFLKTEASKKRSIAQKASFQLFDDYPLDNINSETWKDLWEKAREFAENYAFRDKVFPDVGEEAICVLCQQDLGEEAKKRFISFEDYIRGSTEQEAQNSEKSLKDFEDSFVEIPSDEILEVKLESSGFIDKCEKSIIKENFHKLLGYKDAILNSKDDISLMLIDTSSALDLMNKKMDFYDESISAFEEDLRGSNRDELKNKLDDLSSRYWLSQRKNYIKEYINDLRQISKLKEALDLTSTRSLSTKKSMLSERLITEEYIARFNKELALLGASHIKVELVKSRTTKGHVLHKITLKDTNHSIPIASVLSEGEQRIVSLAAFLADVEGKPQNTPFIFDDPISSLDVFYEENTIKRLVQLSEHRQVIIFSHRISLTTMLEESANNHGIECNYIGLRREKNRAGESGGTPLFAKNPVKALNKLKNDNLSIAKKIYDKNGEEDYNMYAKGLCSEFRIILERIVETILLNDIVKRFNREVKTKGKIEHLPKITQEDIELIEEYMTKYSIFEHSQSFETPTHIPLPEELEIDMNRVSNWIKDFKGR